MTGRIFRLHCQGYVPTVVPWWCLTMTSGAEVQPQCCITRLLSNLKKTSNIYQPSFSWSSHVNTHIICVIDTQSLGLAHLWKLRQSYSLERKKRGSQKIIYRQLNFFVVWKQILQCQQSLRDVSGHPSGEMKHPSFQRNIIYFLLRLNSCN